MKWVDGLGRPTFPYGVGLPTKRDVATAVYTVVNNNAEEAVTRLTSV
jgi:hypothetical protein